MDKVRKFLAFLLLLLAHFLAEESLAQNGALDFSRVGVVDQLVEVDFKPTAFFLLLESDLGDVRQYQAFSIVRDAAEGESKRINQYYIAAPVLLSDLETSFHVSFFFVGESEAFAATPVERWTKSQVEENSKGIPELKKKIASIGSEVVAKRIELKTLRTQFAKLKEQAAAIANVEELAELKLRKMKVQKVVDKKSTERERLKKLVTFSRKEKQPENVDEQMKELSIDLRETAQVTAVADRLNRRRRRAAVANFKRRLAKVKEAENINVDVLAKKALELRKQRQDLETRLNIRSAEEIRDF